MVLQDKEYGLQDFLKDVNFVCPKNFNIKYILIPDTDSFDDSNLTTLENNGYTVDSIPQKSKNIYYAKKDLKSTHSFSRSHLNDVSPLQPMPIQVNMETNTNAQELENPVLGNAVKVVENNTRNYKIVLKEKLAGLPKDTLITFGRK